MNRVHSDKGRTIGRYRCLTLHDPIGNTWEDCLAGEFGEIWWSDEAQGTLKAFKVVNRKYEKIITFNIKDLEIWKSRLKVPSNPLKQMIWAIDPNQRLD